MKIKTITFVNHPVLGDLILDLQADGKPVSAVYIAGENGVGKTAILNSIYELSSLNPQSIADGSEAFYLLELMPEEIDLLFESPLFADIDRDQVDRDIEIRLIGKNKLDWNRVSLIIFVNGKRKSLPGYILGSNEGRQFFKFIFSDVAINFTPKSISSVTSKNLDEVKSSQKTNSDLATEITQLLVDIQALDDSDLSIWAKENIGTPISEGVLDRRISRFRKAFSIMFPSKNYKEIRNVNGKKQVIFNDGQKESFIGNLSSGEKQIVFRGGFFLKDYGAKSGAIGLIDEPEISLHPEWQLKVMNFYKAVLGIDGNESKSQLIIATHSPFILQNYDKKNEKIIILKKNEIGGVEVQKEPKFYGWTHEDVIKEAFRIVVESSVSAPLVLVEGETDEKYLNQAAAALDVDLGGVEIKWVGRIGEKGGVEFTGEKALNQALAFAKSNPSALRRPLILLYDCDTKKPESNHENVSVRTVGHKSGKKIKKGIENILVLPCDFSFDDFIYISEQMDDYGITNNIRRLDKQGLCDYLIDQNRNGNLCDLFDEFNEIFDKIKSAIDFFDSRKL